MNTVSIWGIGKVHLNGAAQAVRFLRGYGDTTKGYVATIGLEEDGVVPRMQEAFGRQVQKRGVGDGMPLVREKANDLKGA